MKRKIQQRKIEGNYRTRNAGARNEIPKEDTSNFYGDSDGIVGIGALVAHNTSVMVTKRGVPKDEVCINGGFVYAIKHKRHEGRTCKNGSI